MNSFKLFLVQILWAILVVFGMSYSSDVTAQNDDLKIKQFIDSLETLIDPTIVYDPTYRRLDNMCDDVPADLGVCSDVIIRAFHKVDICLAEYVFAYRVSKGLPIDRHIDHRRVRNLGPLFADEGWEIPAKTSRLDADYYQPGDIIWWKLSGPSDEIDHIGIVTKNGKVLHNIGQGQVADVTPFAYRIHKVYRPKVYG